jgi:hypothetical protein
MLRAIAAFRALVAGALLSSITTALAAQTAISDVSQQVAGETANTSAPSCASEEIVIYQSSNAASLDTSCATASWTLIDSVTDRAYLIETASPGGTMRRQGSDVAIGRLHPEFARRLASAIREAREVRLPFAGIFSAYRPPAFGIGGFANKFNSLHTYGLAVDMQGIGRPGSEEAKLWHDIAARHGVVCPYGPHNRAEWNHCQPTRLKIILAENPLRDTVNKDGPLSLEGMFDVGNLFIENMESGIASGAGASVARVRSESEKQQLVSPQTPPPKTLTAAHNHQEVVASRTQVLTSGSNGAWFVQLIGNSTERIALQSFYQLQRKHPILGAHRPLVARSSAGKSTYWYRVRVATNNRDFAEKLCTGLRASGASCLVQQN